MILGRRIQHDPRSRNYPAVKAAATQSVLWSHHAPVLDQFFLSACTGFALANCLNTTHFAASRDHHYLDQDDALKLYSTATHLDEFTGFYPPTDTGSSSIGVCKAGQRLGYLKEYRHAFGFHEFAAALQLSPLIIGTNWYDSMTNPGNNGMVRIIGKPTDGHEYTVLGINYRSKFCTFLNSWGPEWGLRGRFRMAFATVIRLLNEDGDVTVPVGS